MRTVFLLGVVVAVVAGCGSEGTGGRPAGGAPASADPLSIEEALASDLDEPLLVEGGLLATDEAVRLCSALAESYPPQCAGPSLVVRGLDLAEVDGLKTHGGVSWTEKPIRLLGRVGNGVLTISDTARA